jgi:hypothetical protein
VTVDYNHLLQFVPKYEDLSVADLREHDEKAFE